MKTLNDFFFFSYFWHTNRESQCKNAWVPVISAI